MQSKFRHVALIGKYQSVVPGTVAESSRQVIDDIATFLTSQGCFVSLEAETAINTGLSQYPALDLDQIGTSCDLGLVVGGDGTMLGIVRRLARYGTPLIGINQGRLGFITDIPLDSYRDTLTPMLQGTYMQDQRPLMQARVMRGGECVFEALAMNDVVVNRGGTSGMVELRVEVDGHFVAIQRADGLIIASPTGSTAYALSVGGPIIHPSIPGWVLAPIAPHTLSNRPIVLSNETEVTLEVMGGRDISANFDMQSLASVQHGDRITVCRSEHRIRVLHPPDWNYFSTLRKKLNWNEGGY